MTATTIVTSRLILAPLRAEDAPAVFAYRSDPDVSRYQSWVPSSAEEVADFIGGLGSLAFDTPGTWYQLGIRMKDSESLVGDAGVHFPADDPRQAEIGFTVMPAYQRRGIATEAVEGLLGHLFGKPGKHRVFASADPRNAASVAVLKRVGMRQEAHFRESLMFKGEWVDDLVFAILASEWNAR